MVARVSQLSLLFAWYRKLQQFIGLKQSSYISCSCWLHYQLCLYPQCQVLSRLKGGGTAPMCDKQISWWREIAMAGLYGSKSFSLEVANVLNQHGSVSIHWPLDISGTGSILSGGHFQHPVGYLSAFSLYDFPSVWLIGDWDVSRKQISGVVGDSFFFFFMFSIFLFCYFLFFTD